MVREAMDRHVRAALLLNWREQHKMTLDDLPQADE
jgi:hypothetical protein